MAFCSHCGKEVKDEAEICVHCGCKVLYTQTEDVKDSSDVKLAWLSFFIPIVGIILYYINQDTMPLKAKSAGKGALIGVVVSVFLYILLISMFPDLLYYNFYV